MNPHSPATFRTDLVAVLINISKQTRALLALRLSQIGVSLGEDDILLELDGIVTVGINTLASELKIGTPTLSRALDRLAAAGLIVILAESRVRLTPAGIEKRACTAQLRRDLSAEIVAGMGEERIEEMREQLHRVEARLDSKLSRL